MCPKDVIDCMLKVVIKFLLNVRILHRYVLVGSIKMHDSCSLWVKLIGNYTISPCGLGIFWLWNFAII